MVNPDTQIRQKMLKNGRYKVSRFRLESNLNSQSWLFKFVRNQSECWEKCSRVKKEKGLRGIYNQEAKWRANRGFERFEYVEIVAWKGELSRGEYGNAICFRKFMQKVLSWHIAAFLLTYSSFCRIIFVIPKMKWW